MIPKPLRSFVSKLRGATDSGSLQWNEGASDAFFCDHKQHSIHIGFHTNGETGEDSYYFRLITDGGKDSRFIVTQYEEGDYAEMRDLYSSVMVNANRVEESLQDFFD